MKVFISAGHGGIDPGAVSGKLKEKDINLVEALECGKILAEHGVSVVYSRKKDENDPVEAEVKEANASRANLAVSFHTNAGGGDGCEFFYYSGDSKGKKLASLFWKHVKNLGQNAHGEEPVRANKELMFLNSTIMTAVLCEGFFIDNKNDKTIGDTAKKQKAIGKAYANAILEFLGIKKETTKPKANYTVQVGAFASKEAAKKLLTELELKGYAGYIRTI